METAMIEACKVSTVLKNTGVDCNIFLGAPAQLWIVPKGATFTKADLVTPATFFNTKLHAPRLQRWFPMFGNVAPIVKVDNGKEADVIPVLDNGIKVLVRYGFFNRIFSTINGGICFAKALQSFNSAAYSFILVDNSDRALVRDNNDGTLSALRAQFMFAPSPDEADFKNPAFTNFQVSYSPQEVYTFGKILSGGGQLLDLMGLLDFILELPTPTKASSTTHLFFAATLECSGESLIETLQNGGSNPLALLANFTIKRTDDQSTPVTTAIGVDGTLKNLDITGTFVSGKTYRVTPVGSDTLLVNGVDGYEGQNYVDIVIP